MKMILNNYKSLYYYHITLWIDPYFFQIAEGTYGSLYLRFINMNRDFYMYLHVYTILNRI